MSSSYDVNLEIQDADYEVVTSHPKPNPVNSIPVNPMSPQAKQVRAKQQNAPTLVYTLGGWFNRETRWLLSQPPPDFQRKNPEPFSVNQKDYWHTHNAYYCQSMFPDVHVDTDYFRWFMIPEFPLPNRWNKPFTPLLIVQPGINEHIEFCKPNNFYCDLGLRLSGGTIPEHIFYRKGFNNLAHAGWARISWHIEKWRPAMDVISGHNILSILEGLHNFFRTAT